MRLPRRLRRCSTQRAAEDRCRHTKEDGMPFITWAVRCRRYGVVALLVGVALAAVASGLFQAGRTASAAGVHQPRNVAALRRAPSDPSHTVVRGVDRWSRAATSRSLPPGPATTSSTWPFVFERNEQRRERYGPWSSRSTSANRVRRTCPGGMG